MLVVALFTTILVIAIRCLLANFAALAALAAIAADIITIGILSVFTTPLFGALSDRIGRLAVYRGGALFGALWAFPSWWMIDSGNSTLVYIAVIGGFTLAANSMLGAQCAHFTELFGNRYRYSGVALSREIGAMLSGGVAPLLGIFLVGLAGGAYWVLALYTLALTGLTLIGTWLSIETCGRDLTALDDAVGSAASSQHSHLGVGVPQR